MADWQLYYHLIWATKHRKPVIMGQFETDLHEYLRGKSVALGATIHAVGGIEDHVHVAASIPPSISVATFVGQLKGASSHWVTNVSRYKLPFAWQEGYGALSFGKQALPVVVEYVLDQHRRHKKNRMVARMERIAL
jgi:putative transposase